MMAAETKNDDIPQNAIVIKIHAGDETTAGLQAVPKASTTNAELR